MRSTWLSLSLIVLLAGGATALISWWWFSADPSNELVLQLKDAESKGVELPLAGESSALVSRKLSYDRLSVELQPSAPDAYITATLDFEGSVGGVEVHSLGYERVRFAREGRKWAPSEGLAPLLNRAIGALAARRRALQQGDVKALAKLTRGSPEGVAEEEAMARFLALKERRYEVRGWYLRVERDGVLISEDYRLSGTAADRPVDEAGTRRLQLAPGSNGEFYFPRGLM